MGVLSLRALFNGKVLAFYVHNLWTVSLSHSNCNLGCVISSGVMFDPRKIQQIVRGIEQRRQLFDTQSELLVGV